MRMFRRGRMWWADLGRIQGRRLWVPLRTPNKREAQKLFAELAEKRVRMGLGLDLALGRARQPKSFKDAATAFINFVLRPEMSILITKAFPYSSVNKAALELLKTKDPATYKQYMEYPATNPPADAVKKGKIIIDVGDATKLWDKAWTEAKGSK